MESQIDDGMQFRRVAPDDGPKLCAFWVGLSPQSQRTYSPYGERSSLAAPWEEAAQRYAQGPDIAFAAIAANGRVIGLGVVDRMADEQHAPHFGLGVDDRYHRRGIGSRLATLALQEADRRDAPKVELIVVDYNAPARHLYAKLGFQVTGEPHRNPDGLTYVDMVRYLPAGEGGEA